MNELILRRMQGMLGVLQQQYLASQPLSSASKGRERENFVASFLRPILPQPFRIGNGEIVDPLGNCSGQLDLIVEAPFLPTLSTAGGGTGLYLADSVAAVIEVKSSLDSEWDDVLRTAASVKSLSRVSYGPDGAFGPATFTRVPFLVVGFTGWKKPETLYSKIEHVGVDAALVIDPGLFARREPPPALMATSASALWAFVASLHQSIVTIPAYRTSILDYGV